MDFRIVLQTLADGDYVVSCPDFPDCIAHGKTFEEAIFKIKDMVQNCIQNQNEEQPELLN